MNRILSMLCALALVCALPAIAVADPIKAGPMFLEAKAGKLTLEVQGLPSPLKVDLKGAPPPETAGNTGLKMKARKNKPLPDTGTIPVEIVALSLRSVKPVKIGRLGMFDTKVTLDERTPSEGGKKSKGEIEVTSHDEEGGDFLIRLAELFLKVNFVPVEGNLGNPIQTFVPAGDAEETGGTWSHEETDGYPTIPNQPAGNFFFTGPFEIKTQLLSMSVAPAVALAPEPLTFALLGGGLLLLGLGRRGAARRA